MTTATPLSSATEQFDRLPDSAFVDIKTVAALLGCSTATIRRHSLHGLLPEPSRFGASMIRWSVGRLRAHWANDAALVVAA